MKMMWMAFLGTRASYGRALEETKELDTFHPIKKALVEDPGGM